MGEAGPGSSAVDQRKEAMDNATKWWDTQKAPHVADEQTTVKMSAAERQRRNERRKYWFSVVLSVAFVLAFVGMLKECHGGN